jgi:hypothetical protein
MNKEKVAKCREAYIVRKKQEKLAKLMKEQEGAKEDAR